MRQVSCVDFQRTKAWPVRTRASSDGVEGISSKQAMTISPHEDRWATLGEGLGVGVGVGVGDADGSEGAAPEHPEKAAIAVSAMEKTKIGRGR
jgi:hypothetical protein